MVKLFLDEKCNAAQCGEHGAIEAPNELLGSCACVCSTRAPLFREDRELCVDDLPGSTYLVLTYYRAPRYLCIGTGMECNVSRNVEDGVVLSGEKD